jgi:hypothetical protein
MTTTTKLSALTVVAATVLGATALAQTSASATGGHGAPLTRPDHRRCTPHYRRGGLATRCLAATFSIPARRANAPGRASLPRGRSPAGTRLRPRTIPQGAACRSEWPLGAKFACGAPSAGTAAYLSIASVPIGWQLRKQWPTTDVACSPFRERVARLLGGQIRNRETTFAAVSSQKGPSPKTPRQSAFPGHDMRRTA